MTREQRLEGLIRDLIMALEDERHHGSCYALRCRLCAVVASARAALDATEEPAARVKHMQVPGRPGMTVTYTDLALQAVDGVVRPDSSARAALEAPPAAEEPEALDGKNLAFSGVSCDNRPVEALERPDGSDQGREGPRQWLKQPYPNESTTSSGLPICTDTLSPTGQTCASTVAKPLPASITSPPSGMSQDCSTSSSTIGCGFATASTPSHHAGTVTADLAASSHSQSQRSGLSLSEGSEPSTSDCFSPTTGTPKRSASTGQPCGDSFSDRKEPETSYSTGLPSREPGKRPAFDTGPGTERGEGRGASTGLQEPVVITRIACPQSNLPLDHAERGFVGSIWETEGGFVSHVFGPTGLWKPTDPTIEAGDPA